MNERQIIMKKAKKIKHQKYIMSRKQIKELCSEQVEKAFLLMATAAADELDLNDEALIQIAQRAARYAEYIDDHVIRMNQVSEMLEKSTGLKWRW